MSSMLFFRNFFYVYVEFEIVLHLLFDFRKIAKFDRNGIQSEKE
jgi:hypothetical protein